MLVGAVPPVSAVFNLAAWAGVRRSVETPRIYYETNLFGTLNLLELCREFQIKRFILASTSSVYGDEVEGPVSETIPSNRPLSPYAASKVAAETLLYSYHHLYGMDAMAFRFFTIYGPAGRPDMSVFRFIRAIAEREPITIYGDGTQRRDFTYVDDIARGAVAALELSGFEIINLGNDNPVVGKYPRFTNRVGPGTPCGNPVRTPSFGGSGANVGKYRPRPKSPGLGPPG